MSKELTLAESRSALAATAKEIDAISAGAMEIFQNTDGGFAGELAMATAIVDLRRMLTDEVMRPVMALMNTELGFATDQDPKRPSQSNPNPRPYSLDVVRECFIQSRILGFRLVGNEFNIIAGRFYGAKNGFVRRVRELTKGTCEASFDAPVIAPDGRSAKVVCRASWEFGGRKQDMGIRPEDKAEFVIRINAGMGADGALGKAERKLFSRILSRLTGRVVAEGEATEREGSIEVQSEVVDGPGSGPKFGAATADTKPKEPAKEAKPKAKAQDKAPEPAPTPAPAATTTPEPSTAPAPEAATLFPIDGDPAPGSPQASLMNFMIDNAVSFDAFRGWAGQTGRLDNADSVGSWAEVPADVATTLAKDGKALSRCVVLHGGSLKPA